MATLAAPLPAVKAWAQPRFLNDPFALGVASGEPLADGFVLWTRLAPDLFDPEALPNEAIIVDWVVARDERMRQVVKSGAVLAHPANAHAVHVEVRGLEPQRPYWYQFFVGDVSSPVGRSHTAPLIRTPLGSIKFAFASCQHYELGYFSAYRQMVDDSPDLILHLGDYIYGYSGGRPVRRHDGPDPVTLEDYRVRHALYKTDPDLQRAHAWCPWLVTWDDHEVQNDYAGIHPQDFGDPEAFVAHRAGAYKAYYEHMPLRHSARPRGISMRLYQRFIFGDLITFHVLDSRQYRGEQACDDNGIGHGQLVEDCDEADDPERSILGREQERWLINGLRHWETRWTVLAQQTLFAEFDQKPGPGKAVWSDGWSGYSASRRRITDALRDYKVANPVIIGGDLHSFWVNDVHASTEDAGTPPVATEFVGSSITASGPPAERFLPLLVENPHIRYFDAAHRGYVACTVDRTTWQSALQVVDDLANPKAITRTSGIFIVESGRPGAQKA